MEMAEGIVLPDNVSEVNANVIENTFMLATDHLKENVCSFLFEKNTAMIENWTVASWSSCTQRAYIMKHGNIRDREKLPDATRYNASHHTRRTLKRKNPSTSINI